MEFLRSFVLTGFPWYYLGHTQHYVVTMIQIADLGGAYMVSFVVAMFNALIFEWLYLSATVRACFRLRQPTAQLRFLKMPRWVFWQTAIVTAVLVATALYGTMRLREVEFEEGPRIALLQGNIDQNDRNDAFNDSNGPKDPKEAVKAHMAAVQKITAQYAPLCHYVVEKYPKGVDLMIWPETSFPSEWRETNKGIQPFQEPPHWEETLENVHDQVRQLASYSKISQLLGVNTRVLNKPYGPNVEKPFTQYNSALLVNANGTTGGRYDKIHRIPFGEYVPMREEWPWLAKFTPYEGFDYSITPGNEMKRFDLGKFKFGVLVCYEDTDPFLARQYGAVHPDGPPVDFLVNISNDGWYAGTSEHNEHLAISRFRAIETRKALVRAVNMGISAVIDPNGQVLQPFPIGRDNQAEYWDIGQVRPGMPELPLTGAGYQNWNYFKQKTGVLTAQVPIDTRITLYSLWGDWFAGVCWTLAGIGVLLAFLPWKRLRPAF
jgi:apolipoprotein N-acyltransferase